MKFSLAQETFIYLIYLYHWFYLIIMFFPSKKNFFQEHSLQFSILLPHLLLSWEPLWQFRSRDNLFKKEQTICKYSYHVSLTPILGPVWFPTKVFREENQWRWKTLVQQLDESQDLLAHLLCFRIFDSFLVKLIMSLNNFQWNVHK